MNEIIVLDLAFEFGNTKDSIHPAILKDDEETILVDCAYPGFLPKMKEAALEKGLSLENITKIIITHHDYDHMGALAEFKKAYPSAQILAHNAQVPYIEGKEKSLRLQQAEAMYEFLPEEQKPGAKYLHKLFASVSPATVDIALSGNEVFPWCEGCEIISTPGHMPGHISLYLKKYKTLISGDALAITNGKLSIANPEFTLDINEAKESIRKLMSLDIEKVICYHGGVFDGDVKKALEELLK